MASVARFLRGIVSTVTGRGMFWLMLMMSEFFESVNTYRDAMRAHVKEELDRYADPCPALAAGACRQPVFN